MANRNLVWGVILLVISLPAAALGQGLPFSWGRNNQGQLGNGTTTDSNVPHLVANPLTVSRMAGGEHHSLQVTLETTVQSWGDNAYGQLGDNTYVDHAVPADVFDSTGVCCLRDVIEVAGGQMHSLALKSDGTVWAWGNNQYGQLGNGTTTSSAVPVRLPLDGIVAIAAGNEHSVALDVSGAVWTWGRNQLGQLGDGTFHTRLFPQRVPYLRGMMIEAIAAGGAHTLALTSGEVLAWGNNDEGQLGNGTTNLAGSPVPGWVLDPGGKARLADVSAIGVGQRHSLAVRGGARNVWSWGSDTYGQLGQGACNVINTLPVQSGAITEIVQVAGGAGHSLARRADGAVFSWGHNHFGQLGNGNNGAFICGPVGIQTTPGVAGPLGFASWIAAGAFHSLAVIH